MGDIIPRSRKMPAVSRTHGEPKCQSCKECIRRSNATLKKHLWDKRTHIERGLIITVAIFFLAIFSLSIAVYVLSTMVQESILLSEVCLTKDCINTASHLLNRMDNTLNPCDNFYEFICTKFLQDSYVPEVDQESVVPNTEGVNMFSVNQEVFNARIMNVLDIVNYSDPKSLWKARTYYKSCTEEDRIEKLGMEPLMNLIDSLGGWPVLDPFWDDDGFEWVEMLTKLSSNGLDSSFFFSVNLMPDEKGTYYIFTLDEPHMNVPAEIDDLPSRSKISVSSFLEQVHDSQVLNYFHYMVNASVLFGANRTIAEQELWKVLEFESQLLKNQRRSKTSMDTSKPFSLSKLHKVIPGVDWMVYFGKSLPFKITGDELVYDSNNQFFKNVIATINKTPKKVLANFIMWKVVRSNLEYMSVQAREVAAIYEHTSECGETSTPRWLQCLTTVWEQMVAPAAVYIRRFLSPEIKSKVQDVFTGIHNELLESLSYYERFNDLQRAEALEIVKSIDHFVFPDELLDDGELDEYYEQLSFNNDEYFHNILKMKKFLRDAKLSEFLRPPDAPHWGNIRYPISLGKLQKPYLEYFVELPFTLLVGLSFHADRPQYANFATLGRKIGETLIDKLPVEIQDALFPDKCTDITLSNTLVESVRGSNIETIQALKLAYKAYQRWVSDNEEEMMLPGLNYNPNQLFWITEASIACGRYPESSDIQIETKTTVNGPLSSLSEFSSDFECPSDSKMNPQEKCSLW